MIPHVLEVQIAELRDRLAAAEEVGAATFAALEKWMRRAERAEAALRAIGQYVHDGIRHRDDEAEVIEAIHGIVERALAAAPDSAEAALQDEEAHRTPDDYEG